MAEATRIFRLLNFEQRLAAIGALLLAVSTFGPFSFVEVAELTIAVAVLALLRARGLGKEFHLPFGDGAVIAAAGAWAAVLIVVRLFDRPLGQGMLALVCAAILILAGLRELGLVLRDLDRGLVDFPALRNGREVYLCWEEGEEQIGYWHDLDTGYGGRQPL